MIAAMKVARRVASCVLLALVSSPAHASSFERWLRNPYPVADGFSYPVGDGEGGGAYTDAAGKRYDGWYVATTSVTRTRWASTPARTGTVGAAATRTSASP